MHSNYFLLLVKENFIIFLSLVQFIDFIAGQYIDQINDIKRENNLLSVKICN